MLSVSAVTKDHHIFDKTSCKKMKELCFEVIHYIWGRYANVWASIFLCKYQNILTSDNDTAV